MGYENAVVEFIGDGGNSSMAITIFVNSSPTFMEEGYIENASEAVGSAKSYNKFEKTPSRIPIRSVSSHRDRDKSSNPREKERDVYRAPFNQDCDVRYLSRFKIWSRPCNQEICPKLEQRFEKHVQEKHNVNNGDDADKGLANKVKTEKQTINANTSYSNILVDDDANVNIPKNADSTHLTRASNFQDPRERNKHNTNHENNPFNINSDKTNVNKQKITSNSYIVPKKNDPSTSGGRNQADRIECDNCPPNYKDTQYDNNREQYTVPKLNGAGTAEEENATKGNKYGIGRGSYTISGTNHTNNTYDAQPRSFKTNDSYVPNTSGPGISNNRPTEEQNVMDIKYGPERKKSFVRPNIPTTPGLNLTDSSMGPTYGFTVKSNIDDEPEKHYYDSQPAQATKRLPNKNNPNVRLTKEFPIKHNDSAILDFDYNKQTENNYSDSIHNNTNKNNMNYKNHDGPNNNYNNAYHDDTNYENNGNVKTNTSFNHNRKSIGNNLLNLDKQYNNSKPNAKANTISSYIREPFYANQNNKDYNVNNNFGSSYDIEHKKKIYSHPSSSYNRNAINSDAYIDNMNLNNTDVKPLGSHYNINTGLSFAVRNPNGRAVNNKNYNNSNDQSAKPYYNKHSYYNSAGPSIRPHNCINFKNEDNNNNSFKNVGHSYGNMKNKASFGKNNYARASNEVNADRKTNRFEETPNNSKYCDNDRNNLNYIRTTSGYGLNRNINHISNIDSEKPELNACSKYDKPIIQAHRNKMNNNNDHFDNGGNDSQLNIIDSTRRHCDTSGIIDGNKFSLKRTDTRDLLTPSRNIYNDFVQAEVREWLQQIPLFLSKERIDEEFLIDTLIAEINDLSKELNPEQFEANFKYRIDHILTQLPLWYPGQKNDQISFRNTVTDHLYNRINELNKKVLVNNMSRCNPNVNSLNNGSENSLPFNNIVEAELSNWVAAQSNSLPFDNPTIIDALMRKIVPLLIYPIFPSISKFNLKCAIIEVLNDFIDQNSSTNIKIIQLHKFSENLAVGLLEIQTRWDQCNHSSCSFHVNNQLYIEMHEGLIFKQVSRCLNFANFPYDSDLKEAITNIIFNDMMSELHVSDNDTKKKIVREITRRYNMTEYFASNIANDIISEVKIALEMNTIMSTRASSYSVYTTKEHYSSYYPVTSTPKKKPLKEIVKLNSEEIKYEEKVTNLIREWLESLPEFVFNGDDVVFKETMISDLAGEIVDQSKLEQLTTIDDEEKFRKYIVYRWVNKMNVFDINEIKPKIDQFLLKLKNIPIPELTQPKHGNRQAMAQIQDNYENYQEFHLPKATDILADELSIWVNEQSEIMETDEQNNRAQKINEIVEKLHDKLKQKRPEEEIHKELEQWLHSLVKPENKSNMDQLVNELKARVINLPQDTTLAAIKTEKEQEKAKFYDEIEKQKNCCLPVTIKQTDEDTIAVDKSMRQYISKYIEHNYDVDDPLARAAFSRLLKSKLQRLNTPSRKEMYDKADKKIDNEILPRDKLIRELDYVKDVSDWLKNIAIAPSFNTPGNRKRIDFIIELSRNIFAIEEERAANPNAMDYNLCLASMIWEFLSLLPIEKDHQNNQYLNFILKQLLNKIVSHQNKNYNALNAEDTIDTTGVNDYNIGDFLEEFIFINGSDIADDELKLEAWSVRLLNEIKKMVQESTDPNVLTKGHVYNRLLNVPKPGDESMQQFETEMEYIKEISQWVKNLPLLPVNKAERDERVKMINELTEKITERDTKKLENPNDTKADSDLDEYIANWISNLSLDENHEVVAAVVIQQLLNRLERAKGNKGSENQLVEHVHPELIENNELPNISETLDTETQLTSSDDQPIESIDKTVNTVEYKSNEPVKRTEKTKNKKPEAALAKPSNPASAMVDAIEKWSASLPITGDESQVNALRNDALKKLYQTVGELNVDPRTFNDDLLYENLLIDEVDSVIEKLPQNPELEQNKEQLKNDLIQNIVEAQRAIKDKSAGEQYKHRLEHTIEASMPHPSKNRQPFDPGFEMYKSRLADAFILENFDHANDAAKLKCEKKIRDTIDKHYETIQNKNFKSSTNDEMYNELYSALFKVPIPKEESIKNEVEKIKTRCVIDTWYDKLPLRKTMNVGELYERDKVLATLAKRIHEIEQCNEAQRDKKHKEIKKWLLKLPLLPDNDKEKKISSLAKMLERELKSSVNHRKCVTADLINGKEKQRNSPQKSKYEKTKGKSRDITDKESAGKPKLKKKAVDVLEEVVENWCLSLPIYSNKIEDSENDNMLKDKLVTTIMIKLCELNMDPNVFNDDLLYDSLLDRELDNLLNDVPSACNFDKIKAEKKQQLKDAVRQLKPQFKEEKFKHQYNQNLDNTVAKILTTPSDITPKKEAQYKHLKDDIIDNFVQYKYEKDDDNARQPYKLQIHDAVKKILTEIMPNKNEGKDTLLLRNKLMCEMAKVPAPNKPAFKENVEEIRLKKDVNDFLDNQGLDMDDVKINQVKSGLAKKLNEIELSGHSPDNEIKMKQEVIKHMKNMNIDVTAEDLDKFISKLKSDEGTRRSPPKADISKHEVICECSKYTYGSSHSSCKSGSDTLDDNCQSNDENQTVKKPCYLPIFPRNRNKISICMPAGYYYF